MEGGEQKNKRDTKENATCCLWGVDLSGSAVSVLSIGDTMDEAVSGGSARVAVYFSMQSSCRGT